MDIDLPDWKKLADVQWGEHPLLLFEKDNAVLMLLAEKRQDRTIGFACAACKPFNVKGDASGLELVHFPTELTIVKKLNSLESSSFLLAFTKPTYVQFSKTAISQHADLHAKQLRELTYDVKGLANVTLTESTENQLLSDPSLLFSFLSFLRSAARPRAAQSAIGLDLRGEKVLCSVPSLSLGLVVGGTKQQRLHCFHVLIEEALQQNVSVVVLDTSKSFVGISRANGLDLSEFTAFSLPGLPAGFPVREVTPGKNGFVPISSFSPSSILTPFGLNDADIGKHLTTQLEKKSLEEVEFSDLNQFTHLKLNRVIKLLNSLFQGIFSSSNSLELFSSLGRVFHVDLSSCSEEARAFFALGVLSELEKADKSIFLVFEQDACELRSLLELAVNKFLGSNVSILCHCNHEGDVPIVKSADLFIEVLDKDVAITQGGKPPQRVKLRPTYSACSEN